jgi:hypothetical protein
MTEAITGPAAKRNRRPAATETALINRDEADLTDSIAGGVVQTLANAVALSIHVLVCGRLLHALASPERE